jgi:putative peptidoglycan lipid II flippase
MSERRIGRYHLDDLVSQTGVVELWQGFDPMLERPVSLRLIPSHEARARNAEAAARLAATVDDRRVIAVLDILDAEPIVDVGPIADAGQSPAPTAGDPTTYLVIVSEWVDGRTLTDIYEEREGEPIDIDEAVPVMRQVAIALQHSHELGVQHGRLRPGSLLIAETADFDDPFTLLGDTNVVRIRGLAVDAALWPDDSAGSDDTTGVGSLLYAMLTGRWPLGLVDGMSPAPRLGGRLLPPSQVVADVPSAIDEICMRAIGPAVSGDHRIEPYPDVTSVAQALTAWEQRLGRRTMSVSPREMGPRSSGRRALQLVGRVAVAAVAFIVVAGVGLGGLRLAQGAASPWGLTADPVRMEVLTEVGEGAVVKDPGGIPGEIVPVSAVDFDPLGADESEMPDLVPNAIDRRSDTAWTTENYSASDLNGKGGTGLMLDLGESTPVSAVRLELQGSGSSIQVLVSSTPSPEIEKWTPLAAAEGIGTAIDLRSPRPVVGRYVLIWFTQLPLVDRVYRGGIRDVIVLR